MAIKVSNTTVIDDSRNLTNVVNATVGALTTTSFSGRRVQRTFTTTSSTSITPDISSYDVYELTALSSALTINAPVGSPQDGDRILFRILDNGTARALTWNSTFFDMLSSLPSTTVANKISYIGCIYNSTNSRWDVVASITQV